MPVNAIYRRPEIFKLRDLNEEDPTEIVRRISTTLKTIPRLIPSRFLAAVQRKTPWKIQGEPKHNSRKIRSSSQAGSKRQSRGKFHVNSYENPSATQEHFTAYSKQVPNSSPEEDPMEILRGISIKLKTIPRLIPSRF